MNSFTKEWLRNGQSKYGSPETLRLLYVPAGTFTQGGESPDGLVIEGWASTIEPSMSPSGMIILPSAFLGTIEEFLQHPLMFFAHDWYGVPIGKWTQAEVKPEGLWVKGVISTTSLGADIIQLIRDGVLNMLSIGATVAEDGAQVDEDTGVVTITKLERLVEVSVVSRGANPGAYFRIAASFSPEAKHLMEVNDVWKTALQLNPINGKGTPMAEAPAISTGQGELIRKIEATIGQHGDVLESVSSQLAQIKENGDRIGKLYHELAEKQNQVAAGLVTKVEMDAYSKKVGDELLALTKEIQTARSAENVRKTRFAFQDIRALDDNAIFVTDDNGTPLSQMAQKAFRIFQLPMEQKSAGGEELGMLRRLHDTVILVNAYMAKKGGAAYDIRKLNCYKLLKQYMEYYDPQFAQAMYSTGTGVGDEWVPTEMSAQFEELYRLTPSLETYFPQSAMPSNPWTYPLKKGGATAYKISEATVDNPPVLLRSKFQTGNTTFTATTIGAAIPISPELIEDSIVPMTPEILAEIAVALNEGFEDCLINGDNSATHFDTGASLTSASPDTVTSFKGLRKLAVDLSNTHDAGTWAEAALRTGRTKLGQLGIDPSKLVHVMSVAAYYKALSFATVIDAAKFGSRSTWLTGILPALDGVEIYPSGKYREDLNATGIYDNVTKTKTGFCTVFKAKLRLAQRRGYTVEYDRNVWTQQWGFVGSYRRDFQNMCPSTQKPVSCGYNITTA